MSVPKTTKLTLKRIVENLDAIPSNNNDFSKPKQMSPDQKKKLLQLSTMYENFGECLKNEEALMNAAKGITELCELAEAYALNECGEWFQEQIVQKDMQNLKKRVAEFQKIVKETYARMQQAGVAYQDIGHVLGRYYDLTGNKGSSQGYKETPGPQPLQQEGKSLKKKLSENTEALCGWCGKSLGHSSPTDLTSHGICDTCKANFMAGKESPEMIAYRQKKEAERKASGMNR